MKNPPQIHLQRTLGVGVRKEPSKIKKKLLLPKVKIIRVFFLEKSEVTNPNFSNGLKADEYVDSQSQSIIWAENIKSTTRISGTEPTSVTENLTRLKKGSVLVLFF